LDDDMRNKFEIGTEWVDALRSGDYKQTQETLRSGDSFCCLGVLCDISKIGTWTDFDTYLLDEFDEDLETRIELEQELDNTELSDFLVSIGLEENKLIKLNDDSGYSFKQIADVIESSMNAQS
jgi:hypothetical protein